MKASKQESEHAGRRTVSIRKKSGEIPSDASTIAQYIINRCIKLEKPITNLQLQKILYYIQKEFESRKRIAFYDNFEDIGFGPVILSVYDRFCGFGALPITVAGNNVTFGEYDQIIDNIIAEKIDLYPWEFTEYLQIAQENKMHRMQLE